MEERSEPLFPISTCCLTYPLERAYRGFPPVTALATDVFLRTRGGSWMASRWKATSD
jgi:hypothetical protein